jgi:hypothetical protein
MAVTDFFNQTITLYSRASYNKFGKLVVGAGVNYPARVQEGTKNVLLPNGQVIEILAKVYISPDVTVAVNDKIVYGGKEYKTYSKYVTVDGSGNANHISLELIKWQE